MEKLKEMDTRMNAMSFHSMQGGLAICRFRAFGKMSSAGVGKDPTIRYLFRERGSICCKDHVRLKRTCLGCLERTLEEFHMSQKVSNVVGLLIKKFVKCTRDVR